MEWSYTSSKITSTSCNNKMFIMAAFVASLQTSVATGHVLQEYPARSSGSFSLAHLQLQSTLLMVDIACIYEI